MDHQLKLVPLEEKLRHDRAQNRATTSRRPSRGAGSENMARRQQNPFIGTVKSSSAATAPPTNSSPSESLTGEPTETTFDMPPFHKSANVNHDDPWGAQKSGSRDEDCPPHMTNQLSYIKKDEENDRPRSASPFCVLRPGLLSQRKKHGSRSVTPSAELAWKAESRQSQNSRRQSNDPERARSTPRRRRLRNKDSSKENTTPVSENSLRRQTPTSGKRVLAAPKPQRGVAVSLSSAAQQHPKNQSLGSVDADQALIDKLNAENERLRNEAGQLGKAETDVSRIRAERDAYMKTFAELQAKESEKPKAAAEFAEHAGLREEKAQLLAQMEGLTEKMNQLEKRSHQQSTRPRPSSKSKGVVPIGDGEHGVDVEDKDTEFEQRISRLEKALEAEKRDRQGKQIEVENVRRQVPVRRRESEDGRTRPGPRVEGVSRLEALRARVRKNERSVKVEARKATASSTGTGSNFDSLVAEVAAEKKVKEVELALRQSNGRVKELQDRLATVQRELKKRESKKQRGSQKHKSKKQHKGRIQAIAYPREGDSMTAKDLAELSCDPLEVGQLLLV